VLAVRRVGAVLVAVWAGLAVVGLVVHRLLGVDGTWMWVCAGVAVVVFGAVGISSAKEIEPMTAAERRDTLLGWGAVLALIAVITVGALLTT
jgi:hypothetical protein